MNRPFKIGELASHAQCPAETIRYYEREGLLPQPMRTAGNYRVYGQAHIERLAFIRHCRSLDMTLDEIRQLLRIRDLPDNRDVVHRVLDEHISHVAARIAELRDLEEQLKALRRRCASHEENRCGILDGLGRTSSGGRKKPGTAHVRGTHRG